MTKVINISNKNDKQGDIDYWRSKSYQERLDALEFLRQQYMEMTNAPRRLQRVLSIVKRKQS